MDDRREKGRRRRIVPDFTIDPRRSKEANNSLASSHFFPGLRKAHWLLGTATQCNPMESSAVEGPKLKGAGETGAHEKKFFGGLGLA